MERGNEEMDIPFSRVNNTTQSTGPSRMVHTNATVEDEVRALRGRQRVVAKHGT